MIRRGMRWRFKGKLPTSFSIVMALCIINFMLRLIAFFAIPRFSPTKPDAVHNYPIQYQGGAIYFVQSRLGKYLDHSLWPTFVLIALLFLIMLVFHRDKIERVY